MHRKKQVKNVVSLNFSEMINFANKFKAHYMKYMQKHKDYPI